MNAQIGANRTSDIPAAEASATDENSSSLSEFIRQVLAVPDLSRAVFTDTTVQLVNKHVMGLEVSVPANGRGYRKVVANVERLMNRRAREYQSSGQPISGGTVDSTTLEDTLSVYYFAYLGRKYGLPRLKYHNVPCIEVRGAHLDGGHCRPVPVELCRVEHRLPVPTRVPAINSMWRPLHSLPGTGHYITNIYVQPILGQYLPVLFPSRPVDYSDTPLLPFMATVLSVADPTALSFTMDVLRKLNTQWAGLKIYTLYQWSGRRMAHIIDGIARIRPSDRLSTGPMDRQPYESVAQYLFIKYGICLRYGWVPMVRVAERQPDHKRYLPVELCYVL